MSSATVNLAREKHPKQTMTNLIQFSSSKTIYMAESQFLISYTLGQSHSNSTAGAGEQILLCRSWAAGSASLDGGLQLDADNLSQQMKII